MNSSIVSLDIETTGFDPEHEEVIEIGAIRYEEGKEVDTFQTLVKPSKSIPSGIEVITSISDELVQDAPRLEDVQSDLEAFVKGATILGHNITFDIDFLQAKGILIPDTYIDTWKLAVLFFPHESSHSLEILAHRFQLTHARAHRAKDDAEVAFSLFQYIQQHALGEPQERRNAVADLAEVHQWMMAPVLRAFAQEEQQDRSTKEKSPQETATTSLTQDETSVLQELQQITRDDGACLLEVDPGVRLPAILRQYTEEQSTKTSDAGPALYMAPTYERVRELHQQLSASAETPEPAILHERSGYVCRQRLEQWKQRTDLTAEELLALLQIVLWEQEEHEGRLHEMGVQAFLGRPAYGLSAEAASCNDEQTKEHHGECPWNKALETAQQAAVLVTTQSLLIRSDLLAPTYDRVILTEAGTLYDTLTQRLTQRWDVDRLRQLVQQIDDLLQESSGLQERIDLFLGLVGNEAEYQREPGDESPFWSVRIDHLLIHSGSFWKIEKAAQNLIEELGRMRARIAERDLRGLTREIEYFERFLHTVFSREGQKDALQQRGGAFVRWIEIREGGQVGMALAPLATNGAFLRAFWERARTAVLLDTVLFEEEESSSYLKGVLGLPLRTQQRISPTTYPYREQAQVFLAQDLAEPGKPGYTKQVAAYVDTIAQSAGGKTVLLTTSNAGVKGVHETIALPLKKKGVRVFGQRVSGGKKKIIELFSQPEYKNVLLGGMAFWSQLQEVPAEQIDYALLAKFPFEAPVKPLIAARSEQYEYSFGDYSLPEALLTFRRGIWQLLGKAGERTKPCTIVILDTRTTTRSYGQAFLATLQRFGIDEGEKDDVLI